MELSAWVGSSGVCVDIRVASAQKSKAGAVQTGGGDRHRLLQARCPGAQIGRGRQQGSTSISTGPSRGNRTPCKGLAASIL